MLAASSSHPQPEISATSVRTCEDVLATLDRQANETSRRWIIDCDHTLLLANSTELFVREARPRWLAALICALVDSVVSAIWSGDREARSHWRDPLRVVAISLVQPWTWLLWRRRAPALAKKYLNRALVDRMVQRDPSTLIVASLGTEAILAPLFRDFPHWPILAAPWWRAWDFRRQGKALAATQRFGAEVVANALVLTDSLADRDLLEAAKIPLLATWPDDLRTPGLFAAYLPLRYTCLVKYPNRSYFFRQWVGEDLAVFALAFGWGAWPRAEFWIAAACTVLGVHAIYELGYGENDTLAATRECQPSPLSTEKVAPPRALQAWVWALGLWSLAVWLWTSPTLAAHVHLRFFSVGDGRDGSAAGVLAALVAGALATRMIFALFNRVSVVTRIYFFPGLQVGKTMIYGLFLPLDWVGAALVIAQILRQWTNYLIYRYRGDNRSFRRQSYRTWIFALVCIALGQVAGSEVIALDVHLGVVALWLAWCMLQESRRFRRYDVVARHSDYLEGRTPTPPQ